MALARDWYKKLAASLKLTDVLPELAHDVEVCQLDAERERLAHEYEAADGALLRQIATHLKHDGSGRWSRYVKARGRSGVTTLHERMRIAEGQAVDVVRFDSGAIHHIAYCPSCDQPSPMCPCYECEGGA